MISIFVIFENQNVKKIKLEGHSGYSNKGSDIYCAAVSTVFQGAINCLTDDDSKYVVDVKDGFGQITVKDKISNHDSVVLEVMINELKDLADQNSNYISYSEETK